MKKSRPFDLFQVRGTVGWLEQRAYRIVYWTDRTDDLILYPMPIRNLDGSPKEKEQKKPFIITQDLFWEGVHSGAITEISGAIKNDSARVTDALPIRVKKTAERRDVRATMLMEYMKIDLRRTLITNTWQREMRKLGMLGGVSSNTASRLILRYLEVGMSVDAALRFGYKGSRPRQTSKTKLGRPRKLTKAGYAQYKGINSYQHAELVRNYVMARGDRRPKTVQKQHEEFYSIFAFKETVKNPDNSTGGIPYEPADRLSVDQFRALIKKFKGVDELVRGLPKALKDFKMRPLTGEADDRIPFPGHTYIIDATVGDVYLVSSFDRGRIIGRPVIYFVIDAKTRYILAILVTLSGPNFESARNALYLALSDKKYLLRYLGLEKLQPYFRAGMRPLTLFFDRAELHSGAGRNLADSIEISTSVAAAYRGDLKSIVERSFGVANQDIVHFLPGSVIKMDRERGMPDHRLDAALTLHEFWRIMVLYQYKWNMTKLMHKKISSSMWLDKAKANPLGFWDWGTANLHGSPYYFSQDELMKKILPNENVPLSGNGIILDNRRYTADWMIDDQRFIDARLGATHFANLVMAPEHPALAFCNIGGNEYKEMVLINTTASPSPATFQDLLDFEALKSFQGQMDSFQMQPVKDEVAQTVHKMIEDAKELTKESVKEQSMSNRERVTGIAQNRINERNGVNLFGSEKSQVDQPEKVLDLSGGSETQEPNTGTNTSRVARRLLKDW